MKNNKVSVVIPFFNNHRTIHKTISSIKKNKVRLEIIVVDDGSQPPLKPIKGIKIIRTENKGASHARNIGIRHSKGELIILIDADIIIPPRLISTFLDSKSDVTCATYGENPFQNYLSNYKNSFLRTVHSSNRARFWSGCASVKRHVFDKVEFNESIRGASVEDTEFGIVCKSLGYSFNYLDLGVVHNHKYTFISLVKNDFSKAYNYAKIPGETFIKDYLKFKILKQLYWYMLPNIFFGFIALLGYVGGKLSHTYMKQIPNLFLKNKPVQVTLFVTNKCNLGCAHCLNDKLYRPSKLTLKDVRNISSQLPDFPYLLISGGEPFLNGDLAQIIKIFQTNNSVTNVVIPTNGFYTDKIVNTVTQILKQYRGHLAINVSLDGLQETHDKIRGKNSFNNALKTISALKNMRYGNLEIGVVSTMIKKNEHELVKLYNSLTNIDSFALNIVRSRPEFMPDVNKYAKMVEVLENGSSYNKFKLSWINKSVKKVMRMQVLNTLNKGHQSRCYGGRLNLVIDSDGTMYPCEVLKKSLGEAVNYNIDWNSQKAKQLRKFIRTSKCHCTEECNINMNILYNPVHYLKIIKKL